jgi:RNAse (barnase) inhibitor barstar
MLSKLFSMTKKITIDGNNFSTLDEFYDEVEAKLTKGLDWKIGRNLDAFNDVLRGGFGVHDYEEKIKITWKNSAKSKIDLGKDETINYLGQIMENCHPSNRSSVKKALEEMKYGNGVILFDTIVGITREHEHIKLVLK